MKRKMVIIPILMSFVMCAVNIQASTTITTNQTVTLDGYDYQLWKDMGEYKCDHHRWRGVQLPVE